MFKNIEPKTVAMLLTSIGGLILAFYIFNAYASTQNNHIDTGFTELKQVFIEQKTVNEKLIEALDKNTESIRDLQILIRTTR